jgi:hypothetical protein
MKNDGFLKGSIINMIGGWMQIGDLGLRGHVVNWEIISLPLFVSFVSLTLPIFADFHFGDDARLQRAHAFAIITVNSFVFNFSLDQPRTTRLFLRFLTRNDDSHEKNASMPTSLF